MALTDDLLPLTPRVFLILWALARSPRHGADLLQQIEALGRGQVPIGPASLYEAIQTLSRRGLVEPCDTPEGEAPDRRRRYFRITPAGGDVLREEAERLHTLVSDLREAGLAPATR